MGQAANYGFIGAGARASGLGGAFIAVADDATAIFWNPGGLTHLVEPEISFVGRLDAGNFKVPSFATAIQPDPIAALTVNFASVAYTFKALGKRHISTAASFSTLYDFDQNTKSQDAQGNVTTTIQTGKLSQFAFGGAIEVEPGISFGTAFYWHTGRIVIDNPAGSAKTTFGLQGNPALAFGLFWDVAPQWHAGAMLNFRFSPLDSNVDTNGTPGSASTLGLPNSWGVGVSWTPNENWLFAFDYRLIQWGGLEIGGAKPVYSNGKSQFSDAAQFHIGAEYVFTKSPFNDFPLPIRLGLYTDPSGPQSSTGTSTNVTYFTIGTGLLTEFGEIDLAGEFGTRDYGAGTTESVTRLVTSLIYRF